ncbi:MAG: hypothetical protein ACOZQL_29405 [Myxococcota bacterium]
MLRRTTRAPVDPALPVLRRRASALLADQPSRVRAFVRVFPLLLSARFRRPNLEQEPPGLVAAPRRRRWGRLCAQLELPPPLGWYATAHPLVRSVILAPRADGSLELIVVPVEGLTAHQERRLALRLDAIHYLAARHAPGLELRQADARTLAPSLFAWAAVIAGDVPPVEPGAVDRLDVLARAPSPLLRCVSLLVPPDAPPPLDILRTAHVPSRPLPFLATWSGQAVARDLCALAGKELSATELGGLATQLRTAALGALRRLPPGPRREVRRLVRPALLGSRIPPALREHLERTLRRGRLREVQREPGWELELDGLVLVRAASLDQLRARAVAESPRLARPGPIWPRVAALLSRDDVITRTHALAVLEPGFLRHLVVVIPRSGRPRARRVDVPGLIRQLLAWHRQGVPVELVTEGGCDPALLSRAAQLLKLQLEPGSTIAYELDDARVQLVGSGTSKELPIDVVLRRPRRLAWVPRRADVARSLRRPLATGLPTVHAVAVPHGPHVAVFALDADGALFRERITPAELAGTLSDYREVLRHTDPPTLIATSVHPTLDALAGLRSESGPSVTLELELGPDGEQVLFEGERFGRGAELPWSALAEAVLSHWPPGTWASLSVPRVRTAEPVGALWLLAARSRVLRRVNTHLRRISRLLRAA